MIAIPSYCNKCGKPVAPRVDPEPFFSPGFVAKAVICDACAGNVDARARRLRRLNQRLADPGADLAAAKAGRRPYRDD